MSRLRGAIVGGVSGLTAGLSHTLFHVPLYWSAVLFVVFLSSYVAGMYSGYESAHDYWHE
jgi:uncharacterized membrane protein YtjA (UPF0391 family)